MNSSRYYTGDDAKFTSREIDFNVERGLGTSGTDADPVNVFMVHWTTYPTTSTIKTSINNNLVDITDPGSMPNGKVDVEINSKTLSLPKNGAAVSATVNGPLTPSNNRMNYKLLFNPGVLTNDPPANDTIIFDDITFYYYATPKIFSWKYEQ